MANNQKQRETILANGASAYQSGLSIKDNPYKLPSKMSQKYARIWREGYLNASSGIERTLELSARR